MSKRKCYLCGKDPAEGYAAIWKDGVEKWFCHGDDDDVSCYEVRVIRGYDEQLSRPFNLETEA